MDDHENALIEAVARQLYANWCDDFGHPFEPDWDAYNTGRTLNGYGLFPDRFRQDARELRPYDTAEAVARRMCFNNGIPECHGHKWPACTECTCEGWDEWLPYAERVLEVVRQHAP